MDMSKPKLDIEEIPKSLSVAHTSELRSAEDPMENKAEQPSEKDAISSEKTCDEGKLSSVPIEDEQTRNVTPDASVETSDKSNEDKQDLSADMEQQESTTNSNEGDSSQTGQTLHETAEEQALPRNGTSEKCAEIQEKMLTRDKYSPKGAPKDLNDIDEISFPGGSKPGVNNTEKGSTDAQKAKASLQRDGGRSEESEKETASLSHSLGVKLEEKTSQQVSTCSTDPVVTKVQIAGNKNLKAINLSQIQTVTAASGQKYSMIQKTSAMGSPIYESVDTKEQYYWVSQSELPAAKLSGISEGLRLGKHYALVPLKMQKSLLRKKRKECYRPHRCCAVPDCNSRGSTFPDLTFFKFPKKEPLYV